MRTLVLRLSHLPPVIVAGTAQLVALATVAALALVTARIAGTPVPVPLLVWTVGGVAMVLGWQWGLPRWWRPIQLLFAPALYGALLLALPPWIYLVGLLLCLLLLGNSVRDRVPLYLSSRSAWAALERHLPATPGARVLDLGAGLGGGLAGLAARHPQLQFVGVESSPLLWLVCRLRTGRFANVEVRWRDLWSEPLHDYAVVYAFLSPAPMPRLWTKVKAQMRPGNLFVSNSFEVPGVEADEILAVGDRRGSRLLLWRL